jgi:WD40 repeat protein
MENTNCGIPGYWKCTGSNRIYRIGPEFQPPKPPAPTLIETSPIKYKKDHQENLLRLRSSNATKQRKNKFNLTLHGMNKQKKMHFDSIIEDTSSLFVTNNNNYCLLNQFYQGYEKQSLAFSLNKDNIWQEVKEPPTDGYQLVATNKEESIFLLQQNYRTGIGCVSPDADSCFIVANGMLEKRVERTFMKRDKNCNPGSACFLDRTSLVISHFNKTVLYEHIDHYIGHSFVIRKNTERRPNTSMQVIHGENNIFVESVQNTQINLYDRREFRKIQNKIIHQSHRNDVQQRRLINSINLNGNLIACSYYGGGAEIALFDLRFSKDKLISSPCFNSHYRELIMKVSPDKRFIALPNACGTIRIYEYSSLKVFRIIIIKKLTFD